MCDKENRRTCFKCGASPSEDGIKLFRVLKPGIRNLARCEQWAKYLFPDRNVSSVEFQMKLFNEHRMLCSRHFKDEDFRDGSKKYLLRTAVPCDVNAPQQIPVYVPDQPGPQPSRIFPPAKALGDQPMNIQKTPQQIPVHIPDQPGPSRIVPQAPALGDLTNQPTNKPKTPQQLPVNVPDQPGPSSIVPPAPELPLRDLCNKKGRTEREKMLQAKCQKYLQKICQLQKRINTLNNKTLLNTLANDENVKKLSNKITPSFALLLQGQIRNHKRKIRGRRWSKEEKITALRIFKRSPTCYRLLRRLFTLPSPSTLKSLLNKVPFDVGCNESVFNVLKKYVKTLLPEDNEFILMFDEMSLKKHLNYDIKKDFIEGFQDHGTQGRSEQVAGYALVFMLGGIRKRVKQPIAHYFSSSYATADRLAVFIKEVLHQCFEAGINIAATVCDMDGVNRRALSILGATPEHPQITVGGNEIVTMYDTPHLLKCFRNLFLKYNIECNTNIHSTGKMGRGVAKWSHIQQFHELDNTNPNFVFAPCLKKEHLNPNTKQKMKVNLAAQVLSHSVAAGMFAKISQGSLPTEAAVTANVVSDMDKLFDSLNSDTSDLRRGKPHATNLSATSPHIDLFSKMKKFFSSLKFVGLSRKPPSQEGWIWTINAVELLWRRLSTRHKIKRLATRRLQQDPLENLFGCIRGNCGSNTNPTSGQFVAGLKTAILSNLAHMGTTGNCETDNNVVINNYDTLLSVSQPTATQPHAGTSKETSNDTTVSISSTLAFEVDQSIEDNTAEVQACGYVCGFIVQKLPIKDCTDCKNIFISEQINEFHWFVEHREYQESQKSLNYVTKELIACVEFSASIINQFLKEEAHTNSLKLKITNYLKTNVDFSFMDCCPVHKHKNIDVITQSLFFICIKRFCIQRNRLFAEEASASALKRKMDIILHK